MEFITRLRRSTRQHDSIMVMMDEMTKESHFILVRSTHKSTNIVVIFMKEIVRLHGVPKAIMLDRSLKFTLNFLKSLFNIRHSVNFQCNLLSTNKWENREGESGH